LNHLQDSYGKQEKEKQRQRTRIAMIARVKMTPAQNASTKAREGGIQTADCTLLPTATSFGG
jgi:hypothetical protein